MARRTSPQAQAEKDAVFAKRKAIDPTTTDRVYSESELEFLQALELYRRQNKRPFPTATEYLEVLVSLGYRKVAERGPLPGHEARLAAEEAKRLAPAPRKGIGRPRKQR